VTLWPTLEFLRQQAKQLISSPNDSTVTVSGGVGIGLEDPKFFAVLVGQDFPIVGPTVNPTDDFLTLVSDGLFH